MVNGRKAIVTYNNVDDKVSLTDLINNPKSERGIIYFSSGITLRDIIETEKSGYVLRVLTQTIYGEEGVHSLEPVNDANYEPVGFYFRKVIGREGYDSTIYDKGDFWELEVEECLDVVVDIDEGGEAYDVTIKYLDCDEYDEKIQSEVKRVWSEEPMDNDEILELAGFVYDECKTRKMKMKMMIS
jgi:hypothetical protein